MCLNLTEAMFQFEKISLSKFVIIELVGVVMLIGLVSLLPKKEIKYTDISSDELKQMLQNKDLYLVNVHVPYEGEIEPTDAFVPYDQIEQNLDKLPQDKNAKIVVYCRSGRMSAIAAKKLAELGYKNVYNHLLGMHDWQSKGYPLKLE